MLASSQPVAPRRRPPRRPPENVTARRVDRWARRVVLQAPGTPSGRPARCLLSFSTVAGSVQGALGASPLLWVSHHPAMHLWAACALHSSRAAPPPDWRRLPRPCSRPLPPFTRTPRICSCNERSQPSRQCSGAHGPSAAPASSQGHRYGSRVYTAHIAEQEPPRSARVFGVTRAAAVACACVASEPTQPTADRRPV
jgi:hypothetical protein